MKVVKYVVVGGTAAAVDISIYIFFSVYMNYSYLIVGMCSFILATAVNYSLSIRYVFESGVRFSKIKEIIIVFFVTSAGLFLNQTILFTCVEYFEISKLTSKLMATGIVFFWNYFIRSAYIFNPILNKASR